MRKLLYYKILSILMIILFFTRFRNFHDYLFIISSITFIHNYYAELN